MHDDRGVDETRGTQTDQPAGRSPRGRGVWRVLLGLGWLLPSLWVWATRAGVVLAGHPAYAGTAVHDEAGWRAL